MRAAPNDRPSAEPSVWPAEAGTAPHHSIGRKTRKARKESGKREEEYGVIACDTPGRDAYYMRWNPGLAGCCQLKINAKLSYALRTAFLVLLALGHNRRTKTGAKVFGQFVQLRVAIDFNRLLGCVANHVTVMAPGKMVLQLDLGVFVDHAVQIIGQLVQKFRAFHWLPSPLSRF